MDPRWELVLLAGGSLTAGTLMWARPVVVGLQEGLKRE